MTNTPYPELRIDITATVAAFAKWTAENRRAADEYEAHPVAACIEPDCPRLALVDAGWCRQHARMCGMCVTCQIRNARDGKPTCWTCRHGGPEAAAARMRRRRRGGVR